ncbi:hypothetical protein M9H77_21995 [Catharanthus roseus]|uniref:Uncharacterized protein n=1 Tax=Catharanthus roseus TaxID=4058 RepID=A0ACC0ARQ6_CATRO|nr:hypothetical protein M9H77_21995 [Catharanthus roseus]
MHKRNIKGNLQRSKISLKTTRFYEDEVIKLNTLKTRRMVRDGLYGLQKSVLLFTLFKKIGHPIFCSSRKSNVLFKSVVCIIFYKAIIQQAEAIQPVLHDYASISRQEISYQKSTLFFDKRIPLSLHISITSLLGIPSAEGPDMEKLNGQKERVSSQAGKEGPHASLGCRPSFLLRSLLEGRNLLSLGLVAGPERNVADLIGFNQGCWREDRVRHLFLPYEADTILQIPLNPAWIDDRLIWHFAPNGIYLVKSGSKVRMVYMSSIDRFAGTLIIDQETKVWKEIHGLPVQPKIIIFFWRAAQNILSQVGTGILVRNHQGIPLFAKALHQLGVDSVEYDELLSIIKGYVVGSPLSAHLIVERDSLLAISCLSWDRDDLSEVEP